MNINEFRTYRFVKTQDLNHHGTLFAGRAAEWFVETGLMATSFYVPAENIVLVNIAQMSFYKPIQLGDLIECKSKIVYAGKSSFMAYICFCVGEEKRVEGFISYVNVDENGAAFAHNITLDICTEEEKCFMRRQRHIWEDKRTLLY